MSAPDCSETFRQEAQDLLEQLEQALLDLEQTPDDRELVDSAFRALHTIKGSGAMFGFERVAGFTHGFETAFDQVRKGLVPASRELVAAALAAKDHIRVLIDRPLAADTATEEAILTDLRAAVETPGAKAAKPIPAVEPQPSFTEVTWRISFRLPQNVLLNGTNPLLLLDELRSLGTCTVIANSEGVPSLDEMDPTGCYTAWDVLLTTSQPRPAIDDVFIFVADDMQLQVQEVLPEPRRIGEILIDRGDAEPAVIEQVASRQRRIGELLVDAGVPEGRVKVALAEQKHLQAEVEAAARPRDVASVRVPAERLDQLMDRVGELVIAQARLSQLAASSTDVNVKSIAEEIERLSAGLRDTAMGIRMVPM